MSAKDSQQERTSTKRAKETVLKSLEELPIVVVACKRAGIVKATYYRWVRDDLDFGRRAEKARLEGINFINDLGESQIIGMMKEKKYQAVKYWLDNHHTDYDRRPNVRRALPTGIVAIVQQLEAESERQEQKDRERYRREHGKYPEE
jgi:hypothetical protein